MAYVVLLSDRNNNLTQYNLTNIVLAVDTILRGLIGQNRFVDKSDAQVSIPSPKKNVKRNVIYWPWDIDLGLCQLGHNDNSMAQQ